MAADSSSAADDASSSRVGAGSTPASSPSPPDMMNMEDDYIPDQHLAKLENAARERNIAVENKRKASLKRKRSITKAQREEKAKELDNLLRQSAAFSDILTKKTQVLGRVGTSLDGKALGEHDLSMAEQPKCLVGGTMRDYQLEGVTWMYEVCLQGMSGILADEMGLGELLLPIFAYFGQELTLTRQNDPDNRHHRPSARTGGLFGPAHHHRSLEHPLELDCRISEVGSFYPGANVSRHQRRA